MSTETFYVAEACGTSVTVHTVTGVRRRGGTVKVDEYILALGCRAIVAADLLSPTRADALRLLAGKLERNIDAAMRKIASMEAMRDAVVAEMGR